MKIRFPVILLLVAYFLINPVFAGEITRKPGAYPQKIIQACWIDSDNILISDGNYFSYEARLIKSNTINSMTRILKYNITNNSFKQLYNKGFTENNHISFNPSGDTFAFFDNDSRILTIRKNGKILLKKKILFNDIYGPDRFYERSVIRFFVKWLAVYNDKAVFNIEIMKYHKSCFNMVFANLRICKELNELIKRNDIERIDYRIYDCRENNIYFSSIYTGNDQYERRIYRYSIPDNSLKLLVKDYPKDHLYKKQIRSNSRFVYIATEHISHSFGEPTHYPKPRVLIYNKLNKTWMKPIDNIDKFDVSENLIVGTRITKDEYGKVKVPGEVLVYNLKGEMILKREIPITSKKIAVFKIYSKESPVIIDVNSEAKKEK